MSAQTKTKAQKAAKILGIALFAFLMFFSFNLNITKAKQPNNCGDICSDQADRICIYIVGEGMCYGVGIWE